MAFTLKCRRDGEGQYSLAYGKGRRQVTAVVRLHPTDGMWRVTEGIGGKITPSVRLKDIKDAWGPLAEVEYAVRVALTAPAAKAAVPVPLRLPAVSRPASVPPAISVRKGPPSIASPKPVVTPPLQEAELASKPQFETCDRCLAPKHGWHNGVPPCRCDFNNTDDYTPDPLDPKMFEDGVRLTPVGALDIVFHWMLRNREYVSTNGILDPVWSEVHMVLYGNTRYPHHSSTRFISHE